jgi:hypothetical protein
MENKFTDEMLESQISKNTKEAEELLKDEDAEQDTLHFRRVP